MLLKALGVLNDRCRYLVLCGGGWDGEGGGGFKGTRGVRGLAAALEETGRALAAVLGLGELLVVALLALT